MEKNTRTPKPIKMKKPSKSRGYYGFQKDYPGIGSEQTFYSTAAKNEKTSVKTKVATAVAALLIFILAFLAVSVSLRLSSRTPKAVTVGAGVTGDEIAPLPGEDATAPPAQG